MENTISNSQEITRAKFLESNGLFCFISICKFGSFKNPFATITSLPELYFRIRRFIFLMQTKKVISMNYGSSISSWKPWRWIRLGVILSIRDIYINSNLKLLTKFASSCRSIEFKDILPRNISQTIIESPLFYGYPCFKLESYFFKRQSHKTVKAIMLVRNCLDL